MDESPLVHATSLVACKAHFGAHMSVCPWSSSSGFTADLDPDTGFNFYQCSGIDFRERQARQGALGPRINRITLATRG
jgi:hypothetical protein